MITLPGYSIRSNIFEGRYSLIFRAIRQKDGLPVVLKLLKREYPTTEEIARFKREYRMTASLDLDGVITVYSLEKYQNTQVIVMEDFGGESLDLHLQSGKTLDMKRFFDMGIRLAEVLGKIHQHQLIHKDINPSNIIWNPTTNVLKIIDFGISTQLEKETPELQHPRLLEGTLAYMSPEQTGRMNRSIDYRTDYYSLGATFYRLLTGQLPFDTDDLLELVHCHLARQPESPTNHRPQIPSTLADIILKLMAKNVEDRYQSMFGLQHDLSRCRQQCAEGKSTDFVLGEKDRSDRLTLPQNLYGRDIELKLLVEAFERVSQGGSELMLITGHAGIGKTALIREIHPTLVKAKGNYISGKFDQYKRNIPYSALIQAFQELIRQLLSLPGSELVIWRQALENALGNNSGVVAEVIPELEQIIGQPLAPPELGPIESRNRFNLVFQSFMRVFTKADAPLVLFLDDLQWADGASLHLIQLFLSDPETQYLLIVGAYRDNEVDAAHPLSLMIDKLHQENTRIEQLNLEPLNEDDVRNLLSDAFHRDDAGIKEMTDLCMTKTHGNPFFLGQLLSSLYQDQYISLDTEQNLWIWDIEQIQKAPITDNVVDLMVRKIQSLSDTTQEILKLAACIGNKFDLKTLALIRKKTARETSQDLWESLQEGLILPLDDNYKFSEETEELNTRFSFIHDRVQQAAYSLIPHGKLPSIHKTIGQCLYEPLGKESIDDVIFEIVAQLNKCLPYETDGDELKLIADLNYIAGKKAKQTTAYLQAKEYFNCVLKIQQESQWGTLSDGELCLFNHLAETAYLNGEHETAVHYSNYVIKHFSPLDSVEAYEIKILVKIATNEVDEAVKISFSAFKALGLSIPDNPNKSQVAISLLLTKIKLANMQWDNLKKKKPMSNRRSLALMRIAGRVNTAMFNARPNLCALLCFRQLFLTNKYGIAISSPESLCLYGLILSSSLGEIKSGYKLGKLALELIDRFDFEEKSSKVGVMFNGLVRHWIDPLSESISGLFDAYNLGREHGDLEYSAISLFFLTHTMFFANYNLKTLQEIIKKNNTILKTINQSIPLELNNIYLQMILNLLSDKSNTWHLEGEVFSEKTFLTRNESSENISAFVSVMISKQMLFCWFGEFEKSLGFGKVAKEKLNAALGTIGIIQHYFCESLSRLQIFEEKSIFSKIKEILIINFVNTKIKKWAKHAPMNHLHKYLLVKAEQARVRGKKTKAMKLYDESIRLAKENEYIQEEALANELAGKFYLAEGHQQIARTYMNEARYLYDRWGAKAKVKHLEETYSELLSFNRHAESGSSGGTLTTSLPVTSSTAGEHQSRLDLQAIMKTSRAISSEIRLENLLTTLVKVAVETAGAQRGLLLTVEEDSIYLESEAKGSPLEISIHQSLTMDEQEDLPRSIIRYVGQTGEQVVLNNACQEGQFTGTDYVTRNKPQSVLCVPLQSRGKTSAIIYLEHSQSTHAFPEERLEVLKMLFSQAAISLENARLYQQTKHSLEAEKAARLKQEQADRLKDEFLANTSHEIKTPLHGMIGLSESLMENLNPQLQANNLRDLHSIIASGKRLSSLVDDILDFSRIKLGELDLQLQVVSVHTAVETVIGLSTPLIGNKSLELINAVPRDLPPVWADENRLQQILHNLIGNAIKFTETGKVEIAATAGDEIMELTVSDTGIGIAPAKLDRIFHKFEQLDGSITRKYQGTGLGLAITRKLVEAHHGSISVSSTEGKGSEFVVSLPLATEKQLEPGLEETPKPQNVSPISPHHLESPTEPTTDSQSGIEHTILVVDDDPVNLQVVESQLRNSGYRAQLAKDGMEALEMIHNGKKPDLVLLDVMMPRISGFEFCQQLRERFPAYELPIIFLTAKNQVADLVKGFSIGANDYLTKPFSRDELLARVRNQLQLLQTGRKLSSLRQISRDLEKMKDAEQMILSVFEEINQTLYVCESIVWSDGRPRHHNKGNGQQAVLNPEIRDDMLNIDLYGEEEEMVVIESLDLHHPAYEFCRSLSRESVKGSHWILIRMTGFETYLICLFRRPEEGMFTAVDREYIKSVLKEVDLKRQAMQSVAIDVRLNRSLIEIAEQLEKILYIQGGKSSPYCDIVMESNLDAPSSVRISLQQVQTFFPESSLLRIHNSFLINPRKISDKTRPVRKRGKRDIEILLNTPDGVEIPLPVSRNYVSTLRQLHPDWFE